MPVAIFSTSDPTRAESCSVIEELNSRGVDVWTISRDNPKTAYAVSARVSIPEERIIAGVSPELKG